MVGYISSAVAKAIRAWPALSDKNIIAIRATEGTIGLTNIPLPAIAIQVRGDDGEGNTFFGGGIRLYFELRLFVLIPITNYTFSFDDGEEEAMLDMSDDVIRCMEQTDMLKEIEQKHDFSIQFDRKDTTTSYGTRDAMSVPVEVHEIVYKGSVEFDPKDSRTDYIELEKVNITPKYEILYANSRQETDNYVERG